jgi:hypothetical protein
VSSVRGAAEGSPAPDGGAWRHVRAGLIALVVAVSLFAAAPLPKSVKRSQFDTPLAREEIARWIDLFAAVGIHRTREQLVEDAHASGTFWVGVRRTVLGPFADLFRITGTGQGWGLFTYPDSFPHRLHVWTRTSADANWQVLYAGLDAEHDWQRDRFTYRRVRAIYDGQTTRTGATYDTFTRWAARMAFEDVPEAAQVRVGFVRMHTTEPGRPEDPETKERLLRTFTRGELE